MSVVENSLYCRLSIEQSLSQCCGLSVDDVQQCDCWHHHFSWLVCVQSVSSDIRSPAVGAFDLIDCSLSVVRFVPVFHVGQ